MECSVIKAVIIDDEPHCIELLKEQLFPYAHDIEIVGTANSAMRGLALIKSTTPDLVFLDVSMPGGTGFEMLDLLQQGMFEIVFTSAYEEHAIKAFDYQAVNYLLKPIEPAQLQKVVAQVLDKIKKPEKTAQSNPDKISVNTQKGHQVISIEQIIRFEAEGAYTFLYLEGNIKLLSSQNIKVFENQLRTYPFCRIHKKHLINLKKVKYFTKGKGGHVTLSDGSEISISFRQKAKFLQQLQDHFISTN